MTLDTKTITRPFPNVVRVTWTILTFGSVIAGAIGVGGAVGQVIALSVMVPCLVVGTFVCLTRLGVLLRCLLQVWATGFSLEGLTQELEVWFEHPKETES